MRALPFVALVGCGFPPLAAHEDAGFDTSMATDAPTVTPDAPGPSLTLVDQPLRVAVTETVDMRFTIQATSGAHVTWTLHAGSGSFNPSTAAIDVGSNGLGVIAVTFTAPTTAGDVVHTLDLDDGVTSQTNFTTQVRSLSPVGQSTSFTDSGGLSIAASYLYGQPVSITTPVVVMRLGLFVDSGGVGGRMAIYKDQGASPATLVALTALQALVAGNNDLRVVTPVLLDPGQYWLMANFDSAADVRRGATNASQMYLPLLTTATIPATTAGSTSTSAKLVNFYAEVCP